MRQLIREIWQSESGQDMIEYALLAALVATGASVMMPMTVHASISHVYSRVTSCLVRFGTGSG